MVSYYAHFFLARKKRTQIENNLAQSTMFGVYHTSKVTSNGYLSWLRIFGLSCHSQFRIGLFFVFSLHFFFFSFFFTKFSWRSSGSNFHVKLLFIINFFFANVCFRGGLFRRRWLIRVFLMLSIIGDSSSFRRSAYRSFTYPTLWSIWSSPAKTKKIKTGSE